ncbi:MAG: hypothetical protein U1F26_08575 [Lysobacterales bacterium]
MRSPSQELAFALRSPSSGPLAAVLCALADLFEDPSFNEGHRALLRQLLDSGEIPQFLADRAAERLATFASTLEEMHAKVYSDELQDIFGEPAALPKLRRVV